MNSVEEKLDVLTEIAIELNSNKLIWAVGASLLLYFHGIVEDFHDIDIMVSEEDFDKVNTILLNKGIGLEVLPNSMYLTKYFSKYVIRGIHFDVMAGFIIVTEGDVENYFPLTKASAINIKKVKGVSIPIQPLEEWYTYYKLMGRDEKVRLIDHYWRRHGLSD